jgi:uncharacterized protein (DUF1501 family)
MFNRREMLRRSALLSLSPMVPTFLAQAAQAAGAEKDRRILVVIQLDGGNDGLNTVVPYRDENYAKLRPKLKVAANRVVKLSDEVGFHPSMKAAGQLFDNGRLAVVQGVGYPNPNRSHFESMAIWQSAQLGEKDQGQYGWLGRALDICAAGEIGPHAVYAGGGTTPVTLWSRRSAVATLRSLDEMEMTAPAETLRAAAKSNMSDGDLMQYVSRSADGAFTTAQRLTAIAETPKRTGTATYPDSQLAAQFKLISALIKSGGQARVYYTLQSGYDTHASQQYDHAELLRVLADAVKAFVDDMTASGLDDRVLLLAFSEFGRRAAENASEGTDHGAAAPVIVAGPKLADGLIGPAPNLADLEAGDVKMAIDFRRVYATILDQWLDVRPQAVLAGQFDTIPLFKA